jgi:hypothetical protein
MNAHQLVAEVVPGTPQLEFPLGLSDPNRARKTSSGVCRSGGWRSVPSSSAADNSKPASPPASPFGKNHGGRGCPLERDDD